MEMPMNEIPQPSPAGRDPEGHHLITRMNALVLLGWLDVVEVDRVVRDEDWKRARRLIRSVRDIRALPARGQRLPGDRRRPPGQDGFHSLGPPDRDDAGDPTI
jgi:hypothetical protein